MNGTWVNSNQHQIPAAFVLLAALVLAAFAYSPGLGGSLHFDDFPNLTGLTQVADTTSALYFITQGDAGPTGRVLALASFAPQAYAWPDAPDVFLRVNICLHLLNGTLVVWMLYGLSIGSGRDPRHAAWISAITGAIWMLLPVLASSSLLIVQRMTTLSATFLLLGFIGYLRARSMLETRPRRALLWMTASVVAGTGLATFSKENGALLPLFIFVTEATLFAPPSTPRIRSWWKAWCTIFFVIPAVALFGYLALRLNYTESVLLMRDFSAADRLLTQAHILWQYLYHAFLPATSALGPFHDDHPIYRSWFDPLSMFAVVGWLTVIGAALTLRRRVPLFCFAVGWYLVGHALESTTIPLELYFEHRNYVPLIGPVFALVSAATVAPKWQLIARSGLLSYALMLAIVLFNTTSLWGRPSLAAEMSAIQHPDSERATQYLVQQLEQAGDHRTARRILRLYLGDNPHSASVALQILALSCLLEPKNPHDEALESSEMGLRYPGYEAGTFEALRELYRMAEDGRCDAVTPDTVYDLSTIAAANPAYQTVPAAHHNLHILMAEEAFAERDLDLTMHHLEAALSAQHTMSTVILAVKMLSSAGLYSRANDFVQEAEAREPRNPIRAAFWRRQTAALEKAVSASLHH